MPFDYLLRRLAESPHSRCACNSMSTDTRNRTPLRSPHVRHRLPLSEAKPALARKLNPRESAGRRVATAQNSPRRNAGAVDEWNVGGCWYRRESPLQATVRVNELPADSFIGEERQIESCMAFCPCLEICAPILPAAVHTRGGVSRRCHCCRPMSKLACSRRRRNSLFPNMCKISCADNWPCAARSPFCHAREIPVAAVLSVNSELIEVIVFSVHNDLEDPHGIEPVMVSKASMRRR